MPVTWTLADLCALARGLGFQRSVNSFGVEVLKLGSFQFGSVRMIFIHPDGRVGCGAATPRSPFCACDHSIEGAVAWLLRWTLPGFTAWME